MTHVLVVGESWVTQATHVKGFDQFESSSYHVGVDPLRSALVAGGAQVTHMPAHAVPAELPDTLERLDSYDVIILSDVGADTILLRPETFVMGQTSVNRLSLLRDWVLAGGGLAMAGGYLSFQGIGGRARYRRTPIEDVLPCTIDPWVIASRCLRDSSPRWLTATMPSSPASRPNGRRSSAITG
jgi:uncharacterized membrane protein